MRRSRFWLVPAAALSLFACYAELPGSADVDSLDAGAPGGSVGSPMGGGAAAGGSQGGGLPGGGPADSDAGSSEAGQESNCEGLGVGATQQRIRYAALEVVSPETCESESQSRTCGADGFSAWSGTYQAETCSVGTRRSCGATSSGQSETRQRFAVDVAKGAAGCMAQTQTRLCTDGTWGEWTGDAQYETCQASFLGSCGLGGLFGTITCEANTSCRAKGLSWPRCLGNAGHTCEANGDCVSTCVKGVCTATDPARGGACDDAADCANTLCPNVSGGSASAGCVANTCVCPTSSLCTANDQCSGTCVAQSAGLSSCVDLNTTCDNQEDCRGDHKCIKAGGASTGTCLLPDGKGPCTADGQCEHVCRAGTCGQPGANGETCAENSDCKRALVCRPVGLGGAQCTQAGGSGDLCDEPADCDATTTCAAVSGGIMMCLGATGASCTVATAAYQCASGKCIPCTMGPGCLGAIGSCE